MTDIHNTMRYNFHILCIVCILVLLVAGMDVNVFADSHETTVTLQDLGVLQLVAHDLFDVRRGDNMTPESAMDLENGRLDLSTLLINTTSGDYFDDEIVAKGGEIRNRENVFLFTVSSILGEEYLAYIDAGDNREVARDKTTKTYHEMFAVAYNNTFGEEIPTKHRGQVTPDGNIALRTVHDFLPGVITVNGTDIPILSIPPNMKLSDLDMMQESSPLDGMLDEEFRTIMINHTDGPTIIVDLLEADRTFGDQFSTQFSFDELLAELADGAYNTDDKAMVGIRNLISVVYPETYQDDVTTTLQDLGVLQLVAHDLFDVRRGDNMTPESAMDLENGRLDLSTLLINTTSGDYFDDEIVAKGGEIRNRENVFLFTVSSILGEEYLAYIDAGDNREVARDKTTKTYHEMFAVAYNNTFGEEIPTKHRGQVTPDGNIALRTVHDFLPGVITVNGTDIPILSIPPNMKLSDLDMMQESSPLDGMLDEEFRTIMINHTDGPTIIVDLLEADRTFGDQFSTQFSFDELLAELADGAYNTDDKAMVGIRNLISVVYPEVYQLINERQHKPSTSQSTSMTPMNVGDQFDFVNNINDIRYLPGSNINALESPILLTGVNHTISFVVYDHADIAHFALYMNMQEQNTYYQESDTYIIYNKGTIRVVDPHDLISDVTVSIKTDEADSLRRIVVFDIMFENEIEQTNLIARTWHIGTSSTMVYILNAFTVSAVLPDSQSLLSEDPVPGVINEPEDIQFVDTTTTMDQTAVSMIIRTWSGYESGSVTDTQLLDALDLEYDNDIPSWAMTKLGVLCAQNYITIEEFTAAISYVIANI